MPLTIIKKLNNNGGRTIDIKTKLALPTLDNHDSLKLIFCPFHSSIKEKTAISSSQKIQKFLNSKLKV
jgi:hypothetical protein